MLAYYSEADELLYGGAAGGGKTHLACGLALTGHQRTLYVRRERTNLEGVEEDIVQMIPGGRDAYNSQRSTFRARVLGVDRLIRLGGIPHPGSEGKYQGWARDLLVVDEAAQCLESQVDYLTGWVRSVDPEQRTRTLMCSNPPTTIEGVWLLERFAAWLDPNHGKPALPGELRWFTTIDGETIEVDGPDPIWHGGERLVPVSRSFIPARVTDNRFYRNTGYMARLQALREPLRSQMLYGDFAAGQQDDAWQVIPSEWVRAAQKRWKRRAKPGQLSSMGVDPARGGQDNTVVARRYGWWYDELEAWGAELDTGTKVAAKVLERLGESRAPVHVDVIGIGASVIDWLEAYIGTQAVAVVGSGAPKRERDRTGHLSFVNRRAEIYWRFAELLSPNSAVEVALPPDQMLLGELCAMRYKLTARGIQMWEKDEIKKHLGRSPDRADAVVYASIRTPLVTVRER